MGAGERVRRVLSRGWYRGADYGWALREIAAGLASPQLPAEFAHGERAPVLLLPGVLEDWTMMRRLAVRLHQAGHPVHTLPELKRNTVTVKEASALGSAYLAARDLSGVILVAHSKGGLIGKHMMLGDDEHRFERLVTVATPFAGSPLARLIPHPTVSIFKPDDETILELAAHPEVNSRITSIYPSFDPHIPGGSHLEGAKNRVIEASGHFRILGDPAIIDAVLQEMR